MCNAIVAALAFPVVLWGLGRWTLRARVVAAVGGIGWLVAGYIARVVLFSYFPSLGGA